MSPPDVDFLVSLFLGTAFLNAAFLSPPVLIADFPGRHVGAFNGVSYKIRARRIKEYSKAIQRICYKHEAAEHDNGAAHIIVDSAHGNMRTKTKP